MDLYMQATVTILALINPLICAAIFAEIEGDRPAKARATDATAAGAVVFALLAGTAVVGGGLLAAFGISLDAFRVAGGGVLVWMGSSMLMGPSTGTRSTVSSVAGKRPSLAPLILFAASPGTITGVITLSVHHAGTDLPVTAIVGAAAATAVMWLALLLTSRGTPKTGSAGLSRQLVPRLMGLIVLAMGMQFALAGIKAFMDAT
jgi:multiple antibiotic resistance protein